MQTELHVEASGNTAIVHRGYGQGDNPAYRLPRKARCAARTVNDTGGRDEHSKALERFMAKELGKIDP